MQSCIIRRVRWIMGFATAASLLWLVGCRSTQTPTLGPPPPTMIGGPPPGVVVPPPPPLAVAAAPGQDPYVQELLDILKETKSVDTFIVTLGLVVDAKPDHRQVVPLVIRNAERLGIYDRNMFKDQPGPAAEAFELVSNAIEKLVTREKGAPARKAVPKQDLVPAGPAVPDGNRTQIYLQQENATPVLPPIPEGQRPLCDDPPDHAAVLRALPSAARGVPSMYDVTRQDFEFVLEKQVDKIDPPRFYPLIGPAQLHHCHWKCTVHYNETIEFATPFAFSLKRPHVEVVYMDRDRLYLWQPPAQVTGRK